MNRRRVVLGRPPRDVAYQTALGRMFIGTAERILASRAVRRLRGQVDLIFTSPPFPLNRKKKYGNEVGEAYISWLAEFAAPLGDLLAPQGSLVIEIGNAWEPGLPVMSTLALEALLAFKKAGNFYLCQEFIWYNTAKLPTPAQWVNIERIRVKDSFTRFWWLARTPRPKANNRRVLTEYSPAMKALLKTQRYNAGSRPSEHVIGERSFLRDNQGAIPSNVLMYANTRASDEYQKHCRRIGIKPHPARMPIELARFFISFLTDEKDIVMDPFAGSNTTGAAAEKLGRQWLAIEADPIYVRGSEGRFLESLPL